MICKNAMMNVIIWFVILQVISAVPYEYSNSHAVTDQVPVKVATDIRKIVTDLPQKLKKQILETTSNNPGKRFNLDTGQFESTTTAPSNLIINKNNKRYRIKLTKKPGTDVKNAGNSTSIHNTTQTTTSRPSYNESSTYYTSHQDGSLAGASKSTSSAGSSSSETTTSKNVNNYSLSPNYGGIQNMTASERVAVSDDKAKPKQKYRVTTHRTTTTTQKKISNSKSGEQVEEKEEKVIKNICKTLNIAPKDIRSFVKKYYKLDISKEEDLDELKTAYEDFEHKVSNSPKSNNPKTYKELFLQELNNSKSIGKNELIKTPAKTEKGVNETEVLIEDLTHFLKPLVNISQNETEKLLLNLTSPADTFDENKKVYELANGGAIRVEKAKKGKNGDDNAENVERYVIKTTASSKEQLPPPMSFDESERESEPSESNQKKTILETPHSEYKSKNSLALNSILRKRPALDLTENEYSDESSIESNESQDQKSKSGEPYEFNKSFSDSEQISEETTSEITKTVSALDTSDDSPYDDVKSSILPLRPQQRIIPRVNKRRNNTRTPDIIRNTGRSENENENLVIGLPSTTDPSAVDKTVADVPAETKTDNLDITPPSLTTDINLTQNLPQATEDARIEESSSGIKTENSDPTAPSVTMDINLSNPENLDTAAPSITTDTNLPQTNEESSGIKSASSDTTTSSVTTDINLPKNLPETNENAHTEESTGMKIEDSDTTAPSITMASNLPTNLPQTHKDAPTEESSTSAKEVLATTTELYPRPMQHESDDSLTVDIPDASYKPVEDVTSSNDEVAGIEPKKEATPAGGIEEFPTTRRNLGASSSEDPSQVVTGSTTPVSVNNLEDVLTKTEENILSYVLKLINQAVQKIKTSQPVKDWDMMIKEDILTNILDRQLPLFIKQAKQSNPDVDEGEVHTEVLIELIRRYPYFALMMIDRINKLKIYHPRGVVDDDNLQKVVVNIDGIKSANKIPSHSFPSKIPSEKHILNVKVEDNPITIKLLEYLMAIYPQSRPQMTSAISKIIHLSKENGEIDIRIKGSLQPSLLTKIFGLPNIPNKEKLATSPSYYVLFHKIPEIIQKIKEIYPEITNIDLREELIKIISKMYPDLEEISHANALKPKQPIQAKTKFKLPENVNTLLQKIFYKFPVNNKPEFKIKPDQVWSVRKPILPTKVKQPNKNIPGMFWFPNFRGYQIKSPNQKYEINPEIISEIEFSKMIKIPLSESELGQQKNFLIPYEEMFEIPENKNLLISHQNMVKIPVSKSTSSQQNENIFVPYDQHYLVVTPKTNTDFHENNHQYLVVTPRTNIINSRPMYTFLDDLKVNNDVAKWAIQKSPHINKFITDQLPNTQRYKNKLFLTRNPIPAQYETVTQPFRVKSFLRTSIDSVSEDGDEVKQNIIDPKTYMKLDVIYNREPEMFQKINLNEINSPDIIETHNIEQPTNERLYYSVSDKPINIEQISIKPNSIQTNESLEYSDSDEPKIIKEILNSENFDNNESKVTEEYESSEYDIDEPKIVYSDSNETNVTKDYIGSKNSDTNQPNIIKVTKLDEVNPENFIENQNYNELQANNSFEYSDTTSNIEQDANVPRIYPETQKNYENTTEESIVSTAFNEPYIIQEIQTDTKSSENPNGERNVTDQSSVNFTNNETEINQEIISNHSIPENIIVNNNNDTATNLQSEIDESVDNSATNEPKEKKVTDGDDLNSKTPLEKLVSEQANDEPKSLENSTSNPNVTEKISSGDILGQDRSGSGSNEVFDSDLPKTKNPTKEVENTSYSYPVEKSTKDLTVENLASKAGLDNSQIELLLDLPRLAEQYEVLTNDILNSALAKLKKHLQTNLVNNHVITNIQDAIRTDMQEMFVHPVGSCPDVQLKNFVNKLTNAIKERAEKFLRVV